MNEMMVDFGQQLCALRSKFGMTQADLAKASNLDPSTISTLETSRQAPWPSTRRALARAFDISLDEFDVRIGMTTGDSENQNQPASTATAEQPSRPHQEQRPWRPSSAQPAAPPPASAELRYAPSKVMEMLNQLGQLEHQLKNYEMFVQQVCAACWTTDATLHITAAFGPAATELRQQHGDFVGIHVSEFCEHIWGETAADFLPLIMHQKAADGQSVAFAWEIEGARFMIYIDPLRDGAGKVVGTVGIAIDITLREMQMHTP